MWPLVYDWMELTCDTDNTKTKNLKRNTLGYFLLREEEGGHGISGTRLTEKTMSMSDTSSHHPWVRHVDDTIVCSRLVVDDSYQSNMV